MITQQNVYEYIKSIGHQYGENMTVWATKMPSVFNMFVFGSMSILFDLRYNIMNIAENEIIIIGVDNAGKLTQFNVCISKNDIQTVKLKKKFMGYDVEFITPNGSLKYRINKFMIGSKFHKENFNNIINYLNRY